MGSKACGEGILHKPLSYSHSLMKYNKEGRGSGREYLSLPDLLLILLLSTATAATAASPPGASSCAGCHGGGAIPTLAGQPAEAVAAAMLAYKAGERSPTVMDRIARGFDEAEIRAIAAWVTAVR
ncbi:MAG: cytochrome [Belnapia sp.]|nr:cytochrome [Belnapia sp.]